jgi:hypothetical protein
VNASHLRTGWDHGVSILMTNNGYRQKIKKKQEADLLFVSIL